MRTFFRIFGIFSASLFLFAGCLAAPVLTRPPLEEQGAVYLYLKPFSPEADRLAFSIERVAAVKESGEEISMSLKMRELSIRTVSRERLLAFGDLPPGRYKGFYVQVKRALLKGEEDNAALQMPEDSGRIDFPFVVTRKTASVFSLDFRYAESLRGGALFAPRFTVLLPGKTVTGLLGFVTNRSSNSITVFDKITGQVSGVIPTGAGPGGSPSNRSVCGPMLPFPVKMPYR